MDISCVMERRSVRRYTDEAVSEDALHTLLRAGMYAPSARNSQPWEFVVVRQRQALDHLSGGAPYWKMLAHAPLAILVCANLKDYKSSSPEFFKQDCAACTQNILVAARGLGLGAVWLGVYGAEDRMEYTRKALNVPDDIQPFALVSVGHPAEQPAPHDFFIESKVHYEKY